MATPQQLSDAGRRLVEDLKTLHRNISSRPSDNPPAKAALLQDVDNVTTRLREWTANVADLDQGAANFEHVNILFNDMKKAVDDAGETTAGGAHPPSANLQAAIKNITDRMTILNRITGPRMQGPQVHEIMRQDARQRESNKQALTDWFNRRIVSDTMGTERRATFAERPIGSPSSPSPVDFSRLTWFWSMIPKHRELRPGSISFSNNPDGPVFDEGHVTDTAFVLEAFCDAWYAVEHRDIDLPGLNRLRNMSKIVLTLSIVEDGRKGLNDFIRCMVDDRDFPFDSRDELVHILKVRNTSIDLATMFLAQQYRIKEREWGLGQHIYCHPFEPIRLRYLDSLSEIGHNSRSFVDKVEDVSTNQIYARKKLRFDRGNKNLWINERNILEKLSANGEKNHIVTFIKTYQRGDTELGCVISPAADWNLSHFMDHYCRMPAYKDGLKTALLRVFGCLSVGLRHLHREELVRHKDIKPDNILYHRNTDPNRRTLEHERFFWVDFGASSTFDRPDQPSVTFDAELIGTPQYAAPEIGTHKAHGRATDIFSFGCTLLEVISTLVHNEFEAAQAKGVRRFRPYKDNLPSVEHWIERTKARALQQSMPALAKILALVSKMIRTDANRRPSISDVLLHLKEIGESNDADLFCSECKSRVCELTTQLKREDADYRRRHTNNPVTAGIQRTRGAWYGS